MWDFSVAKSLGLMVRTAPLVIFRVIVCFGVTLALILVTGTGAGVGYGIGRFGDDGFHASSTFRGGALGFGLVAGVVVFLRGYLLYLVKAGHVAVMVEFMDGKTLPGGGRQIGFAQGVVSARFCQASALFALDHTRE